MASITYNASPTSAEFHGDNNYMRFIIGPVGSGKTVAGLMEIFLRALQQEPDQNGVRKSRAAIIRNSFPELRSTTLESWHDWFGGICRTTYGSPFESNIEIPDIGDGTSLKLQVYLLGLDDPKQAKRLLSLELTFAFLDECVHIPEYILEVLGPRVGRYPAKKDGGATWSGIWGTSNPCSTDHWFFRMEEREINRLSEGQPLREGESAISFYHNPPGLLKNDDGLWVPNPNAENLDYLPANYYMKNLVGKDDDYIKVFLCGEYGDVRSGKPVYPQYRDSYHCAEYAIAPVPHTEIIIGVDIGIHGNAAVFTQMLPQGQFIIFDELLFEGISVYDFVNEQLKPYLASKYGSYSFRLVLDPAAINRSQSNLKSALDIFIDAGLPAETAPTNEELARREAVAAFLTKTAGPNVPALLLSPTCVNLRRGFISQYKYEDVKGKQGQLKEKPEKNKYSHPADALQYAALMFTKLKVRQRKRRIGTTTAIVSPKAGY